MPGKGRGKPRSSRSARKVMRTAAKRSVIKTPTISRFGFRNGKTGSHTARTIMLQELQVLLKHVNNTDVERADYVRAIEQENCLGKRSGVTRKLSARHLIELYSLDPSLTVFRTLLFFWNRDPEAQPLLALLCVYTRDQLLRISSSYIAALPEGGAFQRDDLHELFEDRFPGRFSESTLNTVVRNLSSTWTKSGHLSGRVRKLRTRVRATVGALSYGLLLGYLSGLRGESLFDSEYVRLLDCSADRSLDLATQASERGWLVFKRISKVVDVTFPWVLSADEVNWTHEQD
jgi:hypothetical protein